MKTFCRRRSHCDRVDADFEGRAKLLLKPEETEDAKRERANTLRDIFMNAAGIAISLLTQRPYLFCQDLHKFSARIESFNIASPVMEGHPMNKAE
jgi:hypothetical protein